MGADIFPQILLGRVIKGNHDEPHAFETIFGYVLMGKITSAPSNSCQSFVGTLEPLTDLNESLQKFWEVEEVPRQISRSLSDEYCESYFNQTTYRVSTGHFVVSLSQKAVLWR